MSGIKSSVRRSGRTTTRVTISDDVDDCYGVAAYSDCYPVRPKSFVIDNNCNIKPISNMCAPWTGNTSEVTRARAKRFARDTKHAHEETPRYFASDDEPFALSGTRAEGAKRLYTWKQTRGGRGMRKSINQSIKSITQSIRMRSLWLMDYLEMM